MGAGKSIRCKIRVTVNDQPCLFVFSEVLRRNNSKRHGALQIFLFVEARFRRLHVGFAPGGEVDVAVVKGSVNDIVIFFKKMITTIIIIVVIVIYIIYQF